jgi:hypothetical protein
MSPDYYSHYIECKPCSNELKRKSCVSLELASLKLQIFVYSSLAIAAGKHWLLDKMTDLSVIYQGQLTMSDTEEESSSGKAIKSWRDIIILLRDCP